LVVLEPGPELCCGHDCSKFKV